MIDRLTMTFGQILAQGGGGGGGGNQGGAGGETPMPQPGQPKGPPGTEGIQTILEWVTWISFGACVLGAIVAGAMMVFAARRGEGGEHAARLGWVFGGCITVAAAPQLVQALV